MSLHEHAMRVQSGLPLDALLDSYCDLFRMDGASFFDENKSLRESFSASPRKIEPAECTMRAIVGTKVPEKPDKTVKEFPAEFWSGEEGPIRAAIALCYAKTFGLGAPDFVTASVVGYLKSRLAADPSLAESMCASYGVIANVFASRGFGSWSFMAVYLSSLHPIAVGTNVKLAFDERWSDGWTVMEARKSDQRFWPWWYNLKHPETDYVTGFFAYNYWVLPADYPLDYKICQTIDRMNYSRIDRLKKFIDYTVRCGSLMFVTPLTRVFRRSLWTRTRTTTSRRLRLAIPRHRDVRSSRRAPECPRLSCAVASEQRRARYGLRAVRGDFLAALFGSKSKSPRCVVSESARPVHALLGRQRAESPHADPAAARR